MVADRHETGTGRGSFYSSWNVENNCRLIAGKFPSVALGNFSEEMPGRNVDSLTTLTDNSCAPRKWTETSPQVKGTTLHVVTDLQPNTKYKLRANGQ